MRARCSSGTVADALLNPRKGGTHAQDLIATAFLGLAAVPASADGPAGGCPVPYTLTAISDIPPVGQPGAIAIDQRGNDDGYVCVMPFPGNAANAIGEPVNGIDNRVQAP